ncbi:hypothetical protein CDD82_1417 [Ophiocordyceps australis]|uniref:Uncharacterized protein n=1 Tax=Ophiocordyceps australis TaxID=1399860 RepID=A0A2C5YJ27_9HYPO|nr:hypothetical protein CDD82_1417 [Ophiocordyceps australis]
MKFSLALLLLPLASAAVYPRQNQRSMQQIQQQVGLVMRDFAGCAQAAQQLSQNLKAQDEQASIQGAANLERNLDAAKKSIGNLRTIGAKQFGLRAFAEIVEANERARARQRNNQ